MISAVTNVLTTSELNKLFEENTGLVYYVYNRLSPEIKSLFEYEELISAGRLGLFKACRRYDGSKSKFATYAIPAIHNEMTIVVRRANTQCRIPVSAIVSLEQPITNSDKKQLTVGDTISDNGECIAHKELSMDVEKFSSMLSERHQIVFKAMIDGDKQNDIAENLGISQSAVSRIITKIQNKFKEYYYG